MKLYKLNTLITEPMSKDNPLKTKVQSLEEWKNEFWDIDNLCEVVEGHDPMFGNVNK